MHEKIAPICSLDHVWIPLAKSAYTKKQLTSVETLVNKFVLERQQLFGGGQSTYAPLMDLQIDCTFVERCGDGHFTYDVSEMASLAEPNIWIGSINYSQEQGVLYALQSGVMKLTSIRTRTYSRGIVLHWAAVSGLQGALDFQIMMTIRFGKETNGFASVDELLVGLSQWERLARTVSDSAKDIRRIQAFFTDHFVPYRHVEFLTLGNFSSSTEFYVSVETFPELKYKILPMWSPGNPFRTPSELSQYIQMTKPTYRPASICEQAPYFATVPMGVDDYIVEYDRSESTWVLVFSPRLHMFYKITVEMTGTNIDDRHDLMSAHCVLSHPNDHIPKDVPLAHDCFATLTEAIPLVVKPPKLDMQRQ